MFPPLSGAVYEAVIVHVHEPAVSLIQANAKRSIKIAQLVELYKKYALEPCKRHNDALRTHINLTRLLTSYGLWFDRERHFAAYDACERLASSRCKTLKHFKAHVEKVSGSKVKMPWSVSDFSDYCESVKLDSL